MATSRPILVGDWLTDIRTGSPFIGSNIHATIHEVRRPQGYILQSDFGLDSQGGDAYWQLMRERVFGMTGDGDIHIAITNGTAPGLYVREGDDTSDWETYRQVLARRVEEAMAARRGGAGVGETTTAAGAQTTTRQEDEIRVGDVVEVVSCSDAFTAVADVGGGGRVVSIEHENAPTRAVYLTPCDGLRVPRAGFVSLADVRKVTSPSPQTVAANVSPMPDREAARSEADVSDKVRRRSVVDGMRRATPRDFTATGITGYLQSLGATHIRVSQAPGAYLPVIEVTGLSQQAFDIARQNLPVGVQLRAVGSVVDPVVGVYLGPVTPTPQSQQPPVSVQLQFGGERETTASRIRQEVQRELDRLYPPSPLQSPQQPPPPPSRFSLLEVDANVKGTTQAPASQAPKASTGLAALQQELRAEREARRALAAAQTPLGRFDLLECDLPAVPVAPVVAIKSPQPSSRPTASSPPPRRPVETITDLTAARSPLELARMLEGLNDELSTLMRQREAN